MYVFKTVSFEHFVTSNSGQVSLINILRCCGGTSNELKEDHVSLLSWCFKHGEENCFKSFDVFAEEQCYRQSFPYRS